jgi:hemerythrin-like domain-containing protein
MAEPTHSWHAEHVNFSRLLDILEEEVAAFHDGETPDYALMLEVVSYLREVPDRVHHPREDAAVACLLRYQPAMQLRVNRLLQEHRVIAAAGEELAQRLNQILDGGLVARPAVETAAAIYLSYYRHHLATEERDIMPLAARLLTRADWQRVAAAAGTGNDPLFGPPGPDNRYRELRRRLAAGQRHGEEAAAVAQPHA